MAFRDALKRRMKATSGFAGGTLEDQLQREGQSRWPQGWIGNMDPQTGAIWENPPNDAPDAPLKTPASAAITVTKGGNPGMEIRPIPEQQRRLGEPADQALRRISQQNNIMGNTGADQQYRDDLASPPLRPVNPFATRARRTHNTTLSPEDEQKFATWKQQNAPNDAGDDYDLRGAFKGGLSPAANGHWADTFKKPNHPTFSNESQYAVGEDAAKAGSWQGDTYVATPALRSPLVQRMQTPVPQEGFGSSGEPFGSTRPRRTQPRDVAADDEQYLRDLNKQPRTWRDKIVDVTDVLNVVAGGQKRVIPTKRERDIAGAQGQLSTDLATGRTQAQIEIAKNKPAYQQASLDEREVNNALSQYNRLEHYDPDDPADAAVRKYFESRGLELPKKDKYRRPIVTRTDDGRIIVTGPEGSQDMQIGGEVVIDTARQPTETKIGEQTFSLPQKQAAQITAQTTTAAANRAAADTRSRRAQEGQDRRLDRRLATPSRAGTGGARPDRATARKAAELVGRIETARKAMEQADVALGQNPNDSAAKQTRANAQQAGEGWAAQLSALDAGYEAGAGEKGFPYYKKREGSSDLDRPIVGKPTGGQYAGKRISKSNVAVYGQRHGMTPEAAAEYLRGQGAAIY